MPSSTMSWFDSLGSISIGFHALALPCLCYYLARPSFTNFGLLSAFLLFKNKDAVLDAVKGLAGDLPSSELVAKGLSVLVIGSFTFWLAGRFLRLLTSPASPTWNGPGKALLFPCRTTHTRTFPQRHSFAYSYVVVGIPVDWTGAAGGMVSVGNGQGTKSCYHIDAADYLERGSGHLGLRGKLDAYLISQGADPGKYPYAYLVTAAKFLGYHFNPVSFWYLYGADKVLSAMILEVNNTFDERRMYYLLPSESESKSGITNPNTSMQAAGESKGVDKLPLSRLTQTWPKDFHVSPFNSRKGSYSLNALDVLSPGMQGLGVIDNTITLRSSKGHGKLVARIFSDGPGLDPTKMPFLQKALFLARWGWVGFATFPRIVKEAGVLFFARKLHVWFRPEPLKDTIGRNANSTERQLEAAFRGYLRHLVEHASSPLAVKYVPGGIADSPKELMLSPSARQDVGGGAEVDVEELEFKVLTPVFYSRFVFYAHDLEALFCELRESSTIRVSRPELLPKLVLRKQPAPLVSTASYGDYVAFKAIQRLRRRPDRIERPMTSSQTTTTATTNASKPSTEDIRGFRISAMDGFVLSNDNAKMRTAYTRTVLKLFLAERLAFGLVPLLDVQRFILESAVAWMLARYLSMIVKGPLGFG